MQDGLVVLGRANRPAGGGGVELLTPCPAPLSCERPALGWLEMTLVTVVTLCCLVSVTRLCVPCVRR